MYRPPVGLPRREQARWQGWLISLLAHLLVVLLVFLPTRDAGPDYGHRASGGGAGAAGGGGGGLGDDAPRVRFVAIAPAAAAPARPARAAPPVTAPAAPVVPRVTPPVPPPVAPVAPAQPAPAAPAAPTAGRTTAGGLGLGRTGGGGAGPGNGGGTGSGIGTGSGTATGAATGGGPAAIHPPTPRELFLPPLPAPRAVHGFTLVAWFDVDSTGKATLLRFTPSPDGGYNRRLRETLLSLRFRPAVRADGVPVRDTVDVRFEF